MTTNVIRGARARRGMSQADVAKVLGLSLNTYNRMENDPGLMRVKYARTLAGLFDMSLDSLFLPERSITDGVAEEEVE